MTAWQGYYLVLNVTPPGSNATHYETSIVMMLHEIGPTSHQHFTISDILPRHELSMSATHTPFVRVPRTCAFPMTYAFDEHIFINHLRPTRHTMVTRTGVHARS